MGEAGKRSDGAMEAWARSSAEILAELGVERRHGLSAVEAREGEAEPRLPRRVVRAKEEYRQLAPEEIDALVAYLRSLAAAPADRAPSGGRR